MRIVTGSILFLALAVQPATGREAFISQLTSKAIATEQAAMASATSMVAATILALPVKPGAFATPSIQMPVAVPGTNVSMVVQSGTNNLANVTQIGGGNASLVMQRGNGNQAIVTQHNAH